MKLGKYIKKLGASYEVKIEEEVIKALPRGINVKYLDLGCYDGAKTLKRAQQIGTTKIFGIEISAKYVKAARNNKIQIKTADLNKSWPIDSASIDCLTATEVIEHLVNVDKFVAEAARTLRKGGKFIISTENLAAYHNIFALVLGNQPYTGPYISRIYPIGHRPNAEYYTSDMGENMYPHLNVMTTKALVQLLKAYKFKINKIIGVGFYPLPIFLANIVTKIDTNHSSYCVVVAEK